LQRKIARRFPTLNPWGCADRRGRRPADLNGGQRFGVSVS
jgi:hypothetical protein